MLLNDPTPLHQLSSDVLVRLGLAAVIGVALGIDRELRAMPAGMRTHGLICFTAAAMTVSVLALYHQYGGAASRLDPLRVVEGASAFLGIVAAGLIVVSKGEVRNLTTAAHLWLAAVIGIACGAGQYPLVAMGTLVAVTMLTVMGFAEKRWLEPMAKRREAEAERNPD